ncbi:ESX secretion-associated protein EspG [Saccharomonospora xinjiangensis]|uniref:ESX secretion-associated protein EspG n=1 Tax=Saccharomonospora xinjiangensis TaxID=75294 RepID=UPI00106F148C|nr:ESX secretion-associated protein EspG [Saccharomonospora xinjiangensis]QBQ60652.1 hypothetical protein EYD13_11495 [Saccharomonospora xinjiangensis]
MTVTAAFGVRFGLPELDLLTTYAGTRSPFPLKVPSFGRIEDERTGLFATAARALTERGLATAHGPAGVAADLVAALREHRGSVDLVVVSGGVVTGAVALFHGQHAVVCRQPIGGTPGPVAVERIGAGAVPGELAGEVPDLDAASSMPITFPPGVLGEATRLLENPAGTAAPLRRVRALVRERGGDPDAVDALVGLLPTVTGRGQLGAVVRREGGAVERPLELSWLDGPRGRVRVSKDGDGWVSVNPLRHSELTRVLRDAVAEARG